MLNMRITPHGYPEVVKYGIFALAATLILFLFQPWLSPVPVLLWVFVLRFFRDPERAPEGVEGDLLSPADGLVTDVVDVEHPYTGKARRIGVFLSVFDVHVNRSPCSGRVEHVQYRPGAFKDARASEASLVNESNEIGIACRQGGRILVRQISGLIARRIVCASAKGDDLARGQRIGMIKFGSRTELCFDPDRYEVCVRPGDRVEGGRTLLARYKPAVAAGAAPAAEGEANR